MLAIGPRHWTSAATAVSHLPPPESAVAESFFLETKPPAKASEDRKIVEPLFVVRVGRLELPSQASEACILSVELRARKSWNRSPEFNRDPLR